MKRLSGFSLMEMMVVLLIVAIVAAASAPMITKKSMSAASEKSPWVWTKGQDIAYNLKGGEATAVIGGISKPYSGTTPNPRLYIKSDDSRPQLTLGAGSGALNILSSSDGTGIGISSSIAKPSDISSHTISIGSGAKATGTRAIAIGSEIETKADKEDSIAIGSGATVGDKYSIVVGYSAKTTGPGGIAIGDYTKAGNCSIAIGGAKSYTSADSPVGAQADKLAIAIGPNAKATGENSVAIGGARAEHLGSIAIGSAGCPAQTTAANQIVLGAAGDTVYIPGNLRVDGNVELAVNKASRVKLRSATGHQAQSNQSRFEFVALSDSRLGLYSGSEIAPTLQSDRRLKNVGKAFVGGLEEIKKLEVFNYTFKKDPAKTPRVGVIAQDLQKIFPQAVFKGDDGFLRIRMEDMFYALVNAVKDLASKFETHDKKIAELEKQNKELIKTIADLEKRLAKLERGKGVKE